jgi:hypothetical protein
LQNGIELANDAPMRIENKLGLIVAILVAGTAAAQEAASFSGTWKGEHAGKTYLLLSVTSGTPLKIALSTSHIRVGENGEIEAVDGPVENDEKLLESTLEGAVLRFKTRQDDNSIMEYEMTLAEGGAVALLKIVGAPDVVKPFRLRRA